MPSTENVSVGKYDPSASSGSGGDATKSAGSSQDADKDKSSLSKRESDDKVSKKDKDKDDNNDVKDNKDDKDGVGGSLAEDESLTGKNKKNDNKIQSKLQNQAVTMAAQEAAHQSFMLMLHMMLQNMIQSVQSTILGFGQWLANSIASIGNAVMHGIAHGVQVIGSGFMSCVNAVAGLLGIGGTSAAVTAGVAVGGVVTATVVAIIGASIMLSNGVATRDADAYDCVADAGDSASGFQGDVSTQTIENARLVYSVYSTYGLSDVNIAGILGNWSVESGIDPTGIETIFNEPFSVFGPQKSVAIANLSEFTRNTVFSRYTSGINRSAYMHTDGNYYCGIGLGQFTGSNAYNLIVLAANMGKDWWDLDVQLVYTIMDGGYRSDFMASWAEEANPSDAAATFLSDWEGINDGSLDERQSMAEYWYTEIASWNADVDYAASIIMAAGNVSNTATLESILAKLNRCIQNYEFDNSSLAKAAVSYAYPKESEGVGNNGTSLYRSVHDYIFPEDDYYMSCDRGVSCAVRWSGYDDDFPLGDCIAQYEYMCANTDKWKMVEPNAEETRDVSESGVDINGNPTTIYRTEVVRRYYTEDALLPGDILITVGDDVTNHVVIYVGHDLIQSVHGNNADASSCIVSASLDERSPGCGGWFSDLENYVVFRNIKKSANPQYKEAGVYKY